MARSTSESARQFFDPGDLFDEEEKATVDEATQRRARSVSRVAENDYVAQGAGQQSQGAYNTAGGITGQAQHRYATEGDTGAIADRGQIVTRFQDPYRIEANDANVNTARTDTSSARANDYIRNANSDGRLRQQQAYDMLLNSAGGGGPSAAAGMMESGAARYQGAVQAGAADAGAAGMMAQAQAQQGYGDAYGQQALATGDAQAAAIQRARDSQQAGVAQQASLAAGARGSNIGMALRNAQMNAAVSNQATNAAILQEQGSANRAASLQAGAAQRAQFGQQSQAGIAANNAYAQGNISAASGYADLMGQAGQLRSNEQLAAQGTMFSGAGQIRGQDLDTAGMELQRGQLGLATDTLHTNTGAGNADRTTAASTADQQARVATNQLNAQQQQYQMSDTLQRQQTNQANRQNNLAREGGIMTTGSGQMIQGGAAIDTANAQADSTNMGAAMQTQSLDLQAQDAAKQRDVQLENTRMGAQSALDQKSNGLLGAAGSIVGAISDVRAKQDIDLIPTPDFRGAGSYDYEYKDPERHGEGRHRGPMAQELPPSTNYETPDGTKGVDLRELSLQNASATGDMQRRLDVLESLLGERHAE